MPCNYKHYPANWKTEIRPAILLRAGNRCERCQVPNGAIICRGKWGSTDVYQNDDGQIFCADTGKDMGSSYVGDVWVGGKQTLTKVVLTIAHLDHDITNNQYTNLQALCQRCHLGHDKYLHRANARNTRIAKRKMGTLF